MDRFVRNNIWFSVLSLKLSLTLPHKGKMLCCSHFRSFIRLINLDRCGNLIENFNFVSTPWKIIIPLAHHPPYHPLNTPITHPTPHQHTTHPHHHHPPTHPCLPHHPLTPQTLQPPTNRENVGPLCLIFHGLHHIVYPFSRQIFGFP